MADKPPPSILRLVVIAMLTASLVCIGYGAWLMATDQGAPVFIFVAGALLAAFASIIASQSRKP